MTKLLLIDKDNTLIQPTSGSKFVQSSWDQTPLPNVSETIARYAAEGWEMAIVSNQGGIAAGHKTLEDTIAEMRYCLELFPQIKEAYFCPDFEGENCWLVWGNCDQQHRIQYDADSFEVQDLDIGGQFRKPNPGMLKLAASIPAVGEILYVGDRDEDQGAALAAGVPFQWAAEFFGEPASSKRCQN